jgi:hypothetical protein
VKLLNPVIRAKTYQILDEEGAVIDEVNASSAAEALRTAQENPYAHLAGEPRAAILKKEKAQ